MDIVMKEDYLVFLDDLRETRETNMFGAAPYLEEEFSELDRKSATKVLFYWMETFSERHPEGPK